MKTKFGPEAKDGDYVLVLDVMYTKGRAETYLAKVHNNKAYTGMKRPYESKYIHKLSAEMVVPKDIVPEDTKKLIEEDIKLHN